MVSLFSDFSSFSSYVAWIKRNAKGLQENVQAVILQQKMQAAKLSGLYCI